MEGSEGFNLFGDPDELRVELLKLRRKMPGMFFGGHAVDSGDGEDAE
jgi:hypothetical protein